MEAMGKADDWISTTIQSLKKASPTSLKIFLRLVCVQQVFKIFLLCSLFLMIVFITEEEKKYWDL